VRSGPTNRNRKPIGDGVPTDRYGAVGRLGGVELTPTTQVHVPASTQVTTEGPPHPYDLPAVSGKSGTTEVLLKVAGALELSPPDQRWYCLGILGFLLAPGAHSLHEVAVTVQANAIALYTPCYRYCGFLGFEMQQAGWYRPMLAAFGSAMRFGYWGELERLCYELASNLPLSVEILSMVFTFLELPFLPPDQWSSWLQEKRRQKLEK
jgi:hypothetical protein